MTKVFDFHWQIPVPDFLLQGACFDRWEEVCCDFPVKFNVPFYK